jgi:RND family efflux transporter MFP subunit
LSEIECQRDGFPFLEQLQNPKDIMWRGAALHIHILTLAFACVHAADAQAGNELAISVSQAELVGIETAALEQQPVAVGLSFPGRLVLPPDRTRLMNAPLGGRIERMLVREDAAVRVGDLLAELQSPALAHAQAEFLVAYKKELLLRTTLEREQGLAPVGAVTRKQVIITENEHEQARATAAERRQALQHYGMPEPAIEQLTASQSLDPRLTITSPVDGVVLETSAVPGQTVEALAPIFRLGQMAPFWVEIQVPALRVENFAVGAVVSLRGHDVVGRVVSIGTAVEPTSQTVIARAEFAIPELDLRPGQVIEAQMAPISRSETEWRIRTAAMVRRGSDAFVFVQITGGFVATPVKVREEMPEFAIVSGSLRGDERIAVRGIAALKGAWQGLGGVQ